MSVINSSFRNVFNPKPVTVDVANMKPEPVRGAFESKINAVVEQYKGALLYYSDTLTEGVFLTV